MVYLPIRAAGLDVGQPAPAFSLPDQNGTLQSLNSLKGPNGVMLVFYRSADW
jgi:peroxiredoxin